MSLRYLFDPNLQFQSRGGVNNVNGFLRVYINGTDDRATTYSNFSGTYNEPDIVLDTDGRAVVIVDDSYLYRIEVYNDLGGLLWTVSDYSARGGEGGGSAAVSVEGTEDEIDVYENTQGGIKHFVLSLSSTIKNAISTLGANLSSLALAVNGKKDRQEPVLYSGSTTRTLTGLAQDENGNISIVFDDIAFPDWTSAINDAVANCEKLTNKKTYVTGYESSNTYYPTIKAMVDFVEAMMQNLGGKLITDGGDAFTNATDLPDTTPFGVVNIQDKDYAYVQGTGFASRYSATVAGSSVTWTKEYEINIPVFTPSQQAAIDSGVTSTKVDNYDSHLSNTDNPHGVTASQVGASPDTHTHQVVINGVTKTIPATGGTPVDLGTYLTSHQDLSGYLTKTGDGKDVTVTYTAQSSGDPANISSGLKLSAIFSKIQYWFTKFGSLAWKNTVTNSDISGTISDSHIDSASTWNNKVSKSSTSGLIKNDGTIDTTKYRPDYIYRTTFTNAQRIVRIGTFASLSNNSASYLRLSFTARHGNGVVSGELTYKGQFDIAVNNGGENNATGSRIQWYYTSDSVNGTVTIYMVINAYVTVEVTDVAIGYNNSADYSFDWATESSVPSGATEINYKQYTTAPLATSVGSSTVPVYADVLGNLTPCDPSSMSVGGANNAGYAAIAGTAHALDTAQGASNVPVYFGSDGIPLKAFSIPSILWVYTTINDDVNGYSLFHPCKLFDSGTVLDSDKYFQYRVKVRNGFIKIIFRWTSNVNTLYSENKVNGNVVWSRLTGSSSTNVDVESVAKSYTNVSSGSDMEIASFELSSNQSYQNIRSQGMVIIDAYQEGARILGTRLFIKFDFNFIKSAGQNTSVDAILDSELYVIGV